MRRVVHEIRNHLAVAIANVEAFRDGVLEPSPARLDAVLQALGEAHGLLHELPLGERARLATHVRRIDVCAVITNEVLAFEAAAAERGIAFAVRQCDVRGEPCLGFDGDPVRVAEIVNNVVSNAVRYTPRGGRIEIDCRRADGVLALTVSDDGPGVRPDEHERIFEPGYRGSAAVRTSGNGVGLALARRFVEEHGGTIAVDPVPGGARFRITLPGTPLAAAARVQPDGTIRLL